PYGGGSAISYQPLADALPKGITLLAVEIPGHDLSRPDNPLQSLGEVARKCVDELKQKANGPIAFYGHCLGGALALEMARLLEKESVEVLGVFEAANFPCPRLPGKWFDLWSKIFPGDRWTSNLAYQDMLKSLGGFTEELEKTEKDFLIRSMRHDFRQAEDYYTHLYAHPPQKLKAPIISIVGEKDRMTEFYQERYHDWEHFSETANYQVIPRSGHYFQKHQSSKLADIITENIEEWNLGGCECTAITSELSFSEVKLTYKEQGVEPTTRYVPPSMMIFLLVAFGQLISMIGTSLTSFSLGIWVYQQSGAVTDFALIGLAASLPGIIVLPLAGALADRYDRRTIMILCDIGSALSIVVAAVLLWTNSLEIWHIYIISSVGSIGNAFQRPAYLAAVTQLVPKQYLGHANGIIQLATSTGVMLAPILGGVLVVTIGLTNIILLDFATFLFATITLLIVRFPNTLFKKMEEPIIKEIIGGWNYILKRKSLVAMVIFFIIFNFLFSMTTTLLTPLILSFDSSKSLGWVVGAAGLGGLVGSIIMSLWGGTKRRADGMVGFVIMTGFSFVLLGFQTNIFTCIIGAFGVWMSLSFINSHWQSLIQVKVGLELQGRIFATNQMLAWSCMPLGYLIIGPLVDRVFEPLMVKGEAFSNAFGWLIGDGVGRGMGLIIVFVGIILAISGVIGLKYRPLRYMEDILPDAIPDTFILDDKDALQEQADRLIEAMSQNDLMKKVHQEIN
ncbi:MAG: MFS transporter, partial [Oscillospiraceae bacterium]